VTNDDARRRLPVAAALTAPVVLLTAVPALQFADWAWVALCLAAPVAVWGAAPFHRGAWRALRRGAATADTLVSIAVLAALGWSLVVLSPAEAATAPLHDRLWALPGPAPRPGAVHLYLAIAALLTVAALAGRAWSPSAAADRGRPAPIEGVGPYALVVALIAAAAAGFWAGAIGTGAALGIATAVVVAACPTALALARPTAHALAARRGTQVGIAVRHPRGLDRATQIDTIVFTAVDLTRAASGEGVLEASAAGAVAELRVLGLRTVLLTAGDPQGALALAGRAGIAEVFAEIVPRDRISVVRRLQNEGRIVAFVGDAADVHDRSALAQADLGLRRNGTLPRLNGTDRDNDRGDTGPADDRHDDRHGDDRHDDSDGSFDGLGHGDGDVALSGDLWSATDTLRLARRTHRVVEGNRVLAFAASAVALPLAAAGMLTPVVVLVAPAAAGLAMLANSARLRSFRSARPAAHRSR
jgi:cation transport ATPase